MASKTVSVIYHWGGNIVDDAVVGVSYEGGQRGFFTMAKGRTFAELVKKIYVVTGFSRNSHNIKMTCRYPYFIGAGHCLYYRFEITCDEHVDMMLSVVLENAGLTSIELYLDIEEVPSSQSQLAHIAVPLVAPRGEYSEFGTTSYCHRDGMYEGGGWPTNQTSLYSSQLEFPLPRMHQGRPFLSQGTSSTPSQPERQLSGYNTASPINEVMEISSPQAGFEAALSQAQREINSGVMNNDAVRHGLAGDEDVSDEVDSVVAGDEHVLDAIDTGIEADDRNADDGDNSGETSMEAEGRYEPSVEAEARYEPISAYFTDTSGFRTSGVDIVGRSVYNPKKKKLAIGMLFKSKQELQHAVSQYCLDKKKEIKVGNTNKTRWEAFCKSRDSGCLWRLGASVRKKHNDQWEIVRYDSIHTCVRSTLQGCDPLLNARFICKEIYPLVKEDPAYKISAIVTLIQRDYDRKVTYFKAWNAKQKAIAQIFGDWASSYKMLPKFFMAIQKFNPGTIVVYDTKPTGNPQEVIFDRVFWAFKPSIDGFKACIPLISIDATHLYGKYQGRLLIAMGKDANGQIYPVAFAIVDKEATRSWGWFLRLLRHHVVKERRDVCLISDRHAGILSAVKDERNGWGTRYSAHHRFCLRHVQSNFNDKYKDDVLKELCWQAGIEHQPLKFFQVMEKIKELDESAWGYLNKIPPELWTLSHDGGHRFGNTTTNISECFNGVLKSARFLPVAACVQVIFFRLVHYHQERRQHGVEWIATNHKWSPAALLKLADMQTKCMPHIVTKFNDTTGEAAVVTPRRTTHRTLLSARECTCRKWQIFQFPCSHAIAVCREYGVDAGYLINEWFCSNNYYEAWRPDFHPILNEGQWDEWTGPTWLPDPELLRKKGRPKGSRYKNEMDQPSQAARNANHCGVCYEPGHDRRKCPHKTDHLAASRMRI